MNLWFSLSLSPIFLCLLLRTIFYEVALNIYPMLFIKFCMISASIFS